MHRPALLLMTIVLGLTTAVTLTLTAFSFQAPASTAPPAATTQVDVIRRFYAAVNEAIASGETAALDSLLTSDFREREPLPENPPDRSGFLRRIATLHDLSPTLRLVPEALAADQNQVVARVSLRVERITLMDIPLASPIRLWGAVDVFRVEDDRISELWSGHDRVMGFQPLMMARLEARPLRITHEINDEINATGQESGSLSRPNTSTSRATLSLDRITLDPGESLDVRAGPMNGVAFVEHGTAIVEVDRSSWSGATIEHDATRGPRGGKKTLGPGDSHEIGPADALVIPGSVLLTMRAESPDGASILLLDVSRRPSATTRENHPPSSPETQFSTSGTVEQLFRDQGLVITGSHERFAVGTLTLSPGSIFTIHDLPGPLALTIATGTLEVEATGAPLMVMQDGSGIVQDTVPALLDSGRQAVIDEGASITLRSAGDETVTILVIVSMPMPAPPTEPEGNRR